MLEVGKLWHETGLQKRSGLWHPQVPRSCSPVIWSDFFSSSFPSRSPSRLDRPGRKKTRDVLKGWVKIRLEIVPRLRSKTTTKTKIHQKSKNAKNLMNETRTPLAEPEKPPKPWCPESQSLQGWHPWHRGCAGTCWQGVGRHLQAVNQLYLFPRRCQKNFLSQLCQLARDNYLLQQVIRFLKFASNL